MGGHALGRFEGALVVIADEALAKKDELAKTAKTPRGVELKENQLPAEQIKANTGAETKRNEVCCKTS